VELCRLINIERVFWVNAETGFADTEDLIIGWQTRRDLKRRGIVEVMEHDSE
jgi:hypothetical protein